MASASAALFVALGAAPAFADPVPSGSEVPAPSPSASEVAPQGQPAEPEQPELQPDVELREPVFEAREYVEGEPLQVTLTIANMGQGQAKEVKAGFRSVSGARFTFDDAQWQDLKTGVTLAPKETRELRVTGHFTEATGAGAQLEFSTTTVNDSDPEDNKKVVSVPVVPPTTKGTVAGTVYLDKDNNALAGAGEGAADVPVTINGPRVQNLTVKTDASGRFEAEDLPAGQYTVTAPRQLAGGWLTQAVTVVVNGKKPNDNILIQAVRPLSAQLKATAKFNEGPYKPGDQATLTITLANSGADAITGVVATCNRADNPVHLLGSQDFERWGDLAVAGQGTTVKAGQTRTFTVTGVVPEKAIDQGVVFVHCDVGRKDAPDTEGLPQMFTLAKVPGKNGTGSGVFYHDKDNDNAVDEGEHVRGLVVTLTDPLDGGKVATTTTGADGGYRFENIPAGWYIPVFPGPWKMKFNEFLVVSADGFGEGWAIPLVTGPDTPPAGAPRNPVAQARKVSADQTQTLATTGANVIGLTIGGIAVLALGIGAVLFTRKRRRS